jgi:hypothetical protein
VGAPGQVGRVPVVPSTRKQRDARTAARARPFRFVGRRVAATRAVRAGGPRHDPRPQSAGAEAGARALRGLDRSDRRRRSAARPSTPAGHRAECRHHGVGLGAPEGLSSRRGLDRPPQPHAQPERLDLRVARAERRLPPRARSGKQQDQPGGADGQGSAHAASGRADDAAALPVLGSRGVVEQQEQRPQPDVRWEGAPVDHIRITANKARITRPRSCFRSSGRAVISRCTIRRPAS